MQYKFILIFCTAIIIMSCSQKPASIVLHPTSSPSRGGYVSKNPYKVLVQKGDTLYSISKKNNVEIRGVIELNRLRAPYMLIPGQTVRLPDPAFHIVGGNDTLYAISRNYSVDISRLAQKNNISAPYSVKKGQKLFLPAKTVAVVEDIEEDDDVEYSSNTRASSDRDNEIESQDLAPIAGNSNIPLPVIKNASGIAATRNAKIETASYSPQRSIRPNLKSKKRRGYRRSSKTSFKWPTFGKVISGFGPKKGGLYNDGINIAAKEGTPIRAAEGGDIVYAGNELRGYGNMLLIKHNNGYLTAYAHADDIVAKKGDKVEKGQLIAHVGQTGHVSTPQLHFSIRKGRKAQNPEKYLPR